MKKITNFGCGINMPHDLNFVSPSRTNLNNNYWVIMCFSTPFIIDSPLGIINGKSGDFIINRPYNHFWHTNIENSPIGFINSWCHISSEDFGEYLNKYQIMPDTIYKTTDNGALFSRDLIEITREIHDKKLYSENMIKILTEKMIINLSRENELYNMKISITDEQHEQMINIRDCMIENYANSYTVKSLAKQINLSAEYFFVLYKRIFNTSPMRDLRAKRISEAKIFLTNTRLPINEIAILCGYVDSNYFSRLFKKITGISPLEYRG